jgi:hypothetical protein
VVAVDAVRALELLKRLSQEGNSPLRQIADRFPHVGHLRAGITFEPAHVSRTSHCLPDEKPQDEALKLSQRG